MNVTVVFAALSYRGRFDVIVNADAHAYPDVDVLVSGPVASRWCSYGAERSLFMSGSGG